MRRGPQRPGVGDVFPSEEDVKSMRVLPERAEILQWAGQALVDAQLLEYAIAAYLVCSDARITESTPLTEAGERIDQLRSSALGALLQELRRRDTVSAEGFDRLEQVLWARNELAHNLFTRFTSAHLVRTSEGRDTLVVTLKSWSAVFAGVAKQFMDQTIRDLQTRGVDFHEFVDYLRTGMPIEPHARSLDGIEKVITPELLDALVERLNVIERESGGVEPPPDG